MSKTMPADAPFDLEALFEVDDYLFTYGDDLTDERSDAEVASLVKLLELNSPMRILDLACGFGRQANRLAGPGELMGRQPCPSRSAGGRRPLIHS